MPLREPSEEILDPPAEGDPGGDAYHVAGLVRPLEAEAQPDEGREA
jgi:hypothetical protein